jgi:hypothetical protein
MNEPANAPHAQAADLTIPHDAQVTAVPKNSYPVHWRRTVITLPDHNDASNASHIGEELLPVINRGATTLIAVVTATVSYDHADANAVVRAYQRALVSGAQLRLLGHGAGRPAEADPQRTRPPDPGLPLPENSHPRRSANNVGPCDA